MNSARQTIFLVDDMKTNLIAGRQALEDAYSVVTFDSGTRLLKALDKVVPDLILLDIRMPEMDGHETLRQIKKNALTAEVPVIFLTSLTNEDEEFMGLSLGAADYITKPFSPPLLRKRIEMHLQLINYNKNLKTIVEEKTSAVIELKNVVLKAVAELVDCRDSITGGHIDRIQRYLEVLIRAMKKYGVYYDEISSYDENFILLSSALHDVGKISIRDSLLLKPGKLSPEEYEELKAHTTFGEDVILRINETTSDKTFLEYAKIFAASHHEKWDGSGYPRGLKGEEIPLLGRILAIADVYDAIISERVYKNALSHSEAVEIILESKGTHFDPVLTDLFTKISDEFEEIHSSFG
ncbi:MAG: response regulator [Oscillospiraceae bacterium]|nr:response regulator [Oscillospiraceae bacterium]